MKKTPTTRAEARELIVRRANIFKINAGRRRWRWNVTPGARLLSMRQLQLAVCICRRNVLVDDQVLELAGFRPSKRPTLLALANAA